MRNYRLSLILLVKRLLLVFFLYQLCRLAFYVFNASSFEDVSLNDFFAGIKFDLSAIVYTNLLIIIGHSIIGDFKYKANYQRVLKYTFFLINLVFIATNVIDIEYFKFTGRRSSFDLITAKGMEQEMKRLVFSFIKEFWYLCGLFCLAMFLFYKGIPNAKFIDEKNKKSLDYIKQFVLFCFVMGFVVLLGRGGIGEKVLSRIDAVNFSSSINAPLVLNTPFCIIKTMDENEMLKKYGFYSEEELKVLYNPIKTPRGSSQMNKKNVVYIILESFGNEHIGYMNKGKGFTPFLDSLITVSTFYKNGFANGKKSIDAMPSMVSAIPSLMESSFIRSSFSFNETESLANILKKEGYQTSFFHGAFNGSQNFDDYAKIAGFDAYYGQNEYPYSGEGDGVWGIFDEDYLRFFAEKLTEFKEPFFSSIFTLSSHNPYTIPEKYKGKFPKGDKKITESIGYTDFSLKQFFDYVKNLAWYENTIFVIVADHTSSEGTDWYKTAMGKFSIPILFFEPGDESIGVTSEIIFQQIDVMPTVLEKLDYSKTYFSYGNSLSDKKRFAISYLNNVYQFITENHFILFDGEKVLHVYDWRKDRMQKIDVKETIDYTDDLVLLKAIIQTYNKTMMENTMTYK